MTLAEYRARWEFPWFKRSVLRAAACLLMPAALSGCYVLKQAWYQNNLINGREPVAAVRADPKTPADLRAKLDLTTDVLKYAHAQGLHTERSYRYFIDTPQRAVSFIVQAAEPDALKFKTWWFPVVGRVPYLGFFDEKDRNREARKLEAEGWDVAIGGAAAFSSLGFFEDPLYRPMLKEDDAGLIHLLFHELTHRTFWSSGSATFNENLAEYVGLFLTRRYLQEKGRSEDFAAFVAGRRDKALFREWLAALRKELTALYGSRQKMSNVQLMQEKAAIFKAFTSEKLPQFETSQYQWVAEKKWNNASVLAAALYTPDTARFERAHACFGVDRPVREFLDALKTAEDRYDDVFRALDSLCGDASVAWRIAK